MISNRQLYTISRNSNIERLFQEEFEHTIDSNKEFIAGNQFNWLDIYSPDAKNIVETIEDIHRQYQYAGFLKNIIITCFSELNEKIQNDPSIKRIESLISKVEFKTPNLYSSIKDLKGPYDVISIVGKFHLLDINKIANFIHDLVSIFNYSNDNSAIYLSDYMLADFINMDDFDRDYITFQRIIGAVFLTKPHVPKLFQNIEECFGLQFIPETTSEEYWQYSLSGQAVHNSVFTKSSDEILSAKKEFNLRLKEMLGFSNQPVEGYLSLLKGDIQQSLEILLEEFIEGKYSLENSNISFENFLKFNLSRIDSVQLLQAISWQVYSRINKL